MTGHVAPEYPQAFDQSQLAQFKGTERYHRIGPKHLLADGKHYLAEKARCYWIMDAIMSHLWEIGTQDWFVVVRVEVQQCEAIMIDENGNGHEYATQCTPDSACRTRTFHSQT